MNHGADSTGTTLVWETEGDPGRVIYMMNDVIVLPLAHYNVLRDSLQNTITFRVDMREAIATGRFDPALENFGVSGQLMDDPYFRITFSKSASLPGVYQGTVPILDGVAR